MEETQIELVNEKPKRPSTKGKPKAKKPDLYSKAGRYFLNKKQGLTKKESALRAGYADGQHITEIERSKTYQAIEKHYYKDELLQQITLREIATAHAENIRQDEDKGARNTAIKMAKDYIEPDEKPDDDDERVMVILKG
jgi:hypothetical protein